MKKENIKQDYLVLAKAAPTREQLQGRIDNGFFNLELHLDGYDFDIHPIIDIFKEPGIGDVLNVYHVHAPLGVNSSLANIEEIGFRESTLRTAHLAQYFANKYNHRVSIVIHAPIRSLSKYEMMLVEEMFEEIYTRYPLVDTLIENIVPVRYKPVLEPSKGYLLENLDFANQFSRYNVYTILDTCHIYTVAEYFKRFEDLKLMHPPNYSVEWFIENNKDKLLAIHLSDTIGMGCLPGEHGAVLKDRKKLSVIFNKLKELDIKPVIVLEVTETDFVNAPCLVEADRELRNFLRD